MAPYTACNLGLRPDLFGLLSEELGKQVAASVGEVDFDEYPYVVFLLAPRGNPGSKGFERKQQLRNMDSAVSAASKGIPEGRSVTVVVLDCVDTATMLLAPDYDVLTGLVKIAEKRLGTEPTAMALRYSVGIKGVFTKENLDEFAILPLGEAFTTEEILSVFGDAIDACGVKLDVSAAAGVSDEGDEVLKEIIEETVNSLGVSQEDAVEITAMMAQQAKDAGIEVAG